MAAVAGAASGATDDRVAWIPLESNPDVMTEYSRLLGAAKGTWLDVLGFDEESLASIPQPVVAVIFIYATTPQFDKDTAQENDRFRASQPTLSDDPSIYFMEQTIRNACGAIAVIHSLANNKEEVGLTNEGPLRALIDQSIRLTPHDRGKALEQSKEIESLHHAMAVAGQTAAPHSNEHVGNHFVAFVHKGGRLIELTGGRPCPVDHGATSAEKLLQDAVGFCQKRMDKILSTAEEGKEGEYRFAVFALTTAFSD